MQDEVNQDYSEQNEVDGKLNCLPVVKLFTTFFCSTVSSRLADIL